MRAVAHDLRRLPSVVPLVRLPRVVALGRLVVPLGATFPEALVALLAPTQGPGDLVVQPPNGGGRGGRRSDSKAGSTENAPTGARGLGLFRRGPGVVTFEWGVVGFRPSFFCGLFRISVLLLPSSSGG